MLRDFFYMAKSDRRIILTALAVIGVAIGIIYLAGGRDVPQPGTAALGNPGNPGNPDFPDFPDFPDVPGTPAASARFAFDPNTADSATLLRLGLSQWQVRNIHRYRAAGGVYRSKEDFAQLYGLTVKQYRELEPYITIGADYQPASTLFPDRKREHTNYVTDSRDSTIHLRYPVKLTEGETIDLAIADTASLQRVPGIGSYYARRIVEYGKRLGGYVSLSQLNEIDGFPQDALPYFTLGDDGRPIDKLNVNSLSINDLKRHPYLNYYQARAIVDYRRQNGPIADIGELRLLPDFGDEAIERLRPYVTY